MMRKNISISVHGARLISFAVFACVAGASLLAAPELRDLPSGLALSVLVLLTALIGMPHGALDIVTAQELFAPKYGKRWFAYFGGVYLAAALFIVLVWSAFPAFSLYAFLLLSILHFGTSDSERSKSPPVLRVLEVLMRGSVPIVFSAAFHVADVELVFGFLSGDAAAQTASSAAAGLLIPLLVFLGCGAALHLVQALRGASLGPVWAVLEVAAVMVVFYVLPPLWAFIVYWIFLHSLRVLLVAAADEDAPVLGSLGRLYIAALPASSFVIVGGLVLYPLVLQDGDMNAAVLSLVFIGLAAVNFPHMFFMAYTEGYRRNRSRG
jgi:Brp/Blh family beta-carotene 15,15'-monooxygenase